jgi:hypothetical protein
MHTLNHSFTRILIGTLFALLICAAEGALFAVDAGIA